MGFAKVNNFNLKYELVGTGPRVIFLNGLGADLKNRFRIFITPLPKHFTVLTFDPRGLGESDSPEEPFSIADMADDAAGLATAIGWDNYHVFGVSMGGMVAQELAIRYPAFVDRLVLGVTHPGGEKGSSLNVTELSQKPTLERMQIADSRQDEIWAAANPKVVAKAEQYYAAVKAAMQANPALMRGYNNQVQAIQKHDTYDRLPQIKASTLVFNGIYDGISPPDIQILAGRIPNARFELVEHGHVSWYFDNKAWDMIINFLQG